MNCERFWLITSVLVLIGCYPKYSGRQVNGERAVMVFEADEGIIVAGLKFPGKCIDGEGSATVMAVWDSLGHIFRETNNTVRVACSRISPLSPEQLYSRIKSVRTNEGLVPPAKPILKQAPGPGAHYRFGRSSLYVSCDSESIQVIHGSYGNREGLEIEHVYSLVKANTGNSLYTKRIMEYIVQLEPLSGF